MPALIMILTALAVGAVASRKPTAKQAVKDAYAEIKAYLQRKGIDDLEALQREPDSRNIRALVAKQLVDRDMHKDIELLDQAKSLLSVVGKRDPVTPIELIDLDELDAAYVKLKNAETKGDANIEIKKSLFSGGIDIEPSLLKQVTGTIQRVFTEDNKFAVVRVLYATDRDYRPHAVETFGNARSKLSLGYCDVSIPRDHRMGELESPSIWRLEFRNDPAKHVVLLKTVIRSKDEFFGELAARVRASARSNAFMFIHGYNVTFEDAARRTAQISYDLAFDGAPVFYSWPSQGTTAAYTVDEQNVEWAQANLRGFLGEFFARSDAQNVYLIAHSMGNRALTRAVASLLTDEPALRNRLKEVILTAPDIDADVFKRDIVPPLTTLGRPVTLYASSEDRALVASKKIHGYPRAGDSGHGLVVVSGVETIDATYVNTSFLGHSYFAENRSVLSDMFYLIKNGERPDMRFGLRRVDAPAGRYWEFKR